MDRARVAAAAAFLGFLVTTTATMAAVSPMVDAGSGAAPVGWPVSSLVISEVQTGGISASDEFAEIANAGNAEVDLSTLELVYVTSSGGTLTRKAAWSATMTLAPGRHLLIANAAGAYASVADASYSGGFAATGGALVLRPIGGAPIDAVAWGDATNAFVEGSAAPAPPAGSSIERLPGGPAGNTVDSNDNSADWFLQPTPNPQNLAAPPAPVPDSSPSPSAAANPSPSAAASPSPSAAPSPSPEITASPEPSPTATASPTATPSATPTPTQSATPSPSATAAPHAMPIVDARVLPLGAAVLVEGVLTMDLPTLESGRVGFVQDGTGGIAVYLGSTPPSPIAAGTVVRLAGTIDERYGARTIRVAITDIGLEGQDVLPAPALAATGAVGEPLEGQRVAVGGTTVGSPSTYADGLGLLVDDGSGPVRVIVGTRAFGGSSVPAGTWVTVIGPVGQRDSTGTGLTGYRIFPTLPGEFTIESSPVPSPTVGPTPAPTSVPTPVPTPVPAPSATPIPSTTPVPSPSTSAPPVPGFVTPISVVRSVAVGTKVTVIGTVTAEAGRLGAPPVIAIADSSGGIAVRLPSGAPVLGRGRLVMITGASSAPYGQLELRPVLEGITDLGEGLLPDPAELSGADLAERTEGLLATIIGTQLGAARRSASGDITVDLVDASGTAFRAIADSSSSVSLADFPGGGTVRLTGIVGQHASRRGALDGYRLCLRDTLDIEPANGPEAGADSADPGPVDAPTMTIAQARALPDGRVTISGVVMAGSGLLDNAGRQIVIQDATGGLEIVLPSGAPDVPIGRLLRVSGSMGLAWGAPRLKAEGVVDLGSGTLVAPVTLTGLPGENLEWRLVRASGAVIRVTRLGERWRADLRVAGEEILVTGVAASGIPSTALKPGTTVSVTGFVRRPYPTASDRRWAIVPRGTFDIAASPIGAGSKPGPTAGLARGAAGPGQTTGPAGAIPEVDLATLFTHSGTIVRVGGLVASVTESGFRLDDGTSMVDVRLTGDAAAFASLVRPGDAVGLVGHVQPVAGGVELVVSDPAGLVRLGTLGETVPIAALAEGSGSTDQIAPADRSPSGAGPYDLSSAAPGMVVVLAGGGLFLGFLRRQQSDRRVRSKVIARLADLRASGPWSRRSP